MDTREELRRVSQVAHFAARTGLSFPRRKVGRLQRPVVDIGGAKILADLATPFGLYLYRKGFAEPEADLLRAVLRPGDVFVDGGAHIGIFTLIAAAAVGPKGRVLACEPIEETMELLRRNVQRNGFHHVDVRAVGLAEQKGHAVIHSFGANSALSSFAPANREGGTPREIEVESLDSLTDGFRDRVRLVKLDVEGAELRAMRGAVELMAHRPDFLLEVEPDHLARQGATVAELEELFRSRGYIGYHLDERRAGVMLRPVEGRWTRPQGNPNIFVSARPREEVLRLAVGSCG